MTARRVISQSRLRVCSMRTSATVASTALSTIRTPASSISPTTRTSFGRCTNDRRFTCPVVSVTAPAGPPVPWADDAAAGPGPAPGSRPVDFDQHGGVLATPVIGRAALAAGEPAAGPLLVAEPAATTLVLPGQQVRRDELGNLVITEGGARP